MFANHDAPVSSVTLDEVDFFESHPNLNPSTVTFTDGESFLPDFAALRTPEFERQQTIGNQIRKAAFAQKRLDVSISSNRVKQLLLTAAAKGMTQKRFEFAIADARPGTGRKLVERKKGVSKWETVGYNGKLWHHYMSNDVRMKARTFHEYVICLSSHGWLNAAERKEALDFSEMTNGVLWSLKSAKRKLKALVKMHPDTQLPDDFFHTMKVSQFSPGLQVGMRRFFGTNLSH